jgi:hypothetical protein
MAILRVRKDVTILRERRDMTILRVRKDVMLLGERGAWVYSPHIRRINVTVIRLSLTLNKIILGSNPRQTSSQIYAST